MTTSRVIVDAYREAFSMGRYSIGDTLPSQADMRAQFGDCSKAMVQSALAELEARGLVSRQKGRNPIVISTRGVRLPQDLTRAELERMQKLREEWNTASVLLADADAKLATLAALRASAALAERRLSAELNAALTELLGRTIPDDYVPDVIPEEDDGADPME